MNNREHLHDSFATLSRGIMITTLEQPGKKPHVSGVMLHRFTFPIAEFPHQCEAGVANQKA